MIKIGKMTDYAMLILSEMAKTPEAVLSANSLAETLYLNLPTTSKILKMLSDAALVQSVRGADGGYKLAKSANTISIVDVITAMEGGVALTECCEVKGKCVINSMCTMRENWRRINRMMDNMLSKFTIVDMQQPLALPEE